MRVLTREGFNLSGAPGSVVKLFISQNFSLFLRIFPESIKQNRKFNPHMGMSFLFRNSNFQQFLYAVLGELCSCEKNRHSVDGITYFEQLIFVNNNLYKAKIATKETHGNKSKYYYHFLEVRTDDKKNKPN